MKLTKTITEMRALGEHLVPFSYPVVSSQDDAEISLLKSRDITVDGYGVVVYYSKTVRGSSILECFQCTGRFSPFLPFVVVANLARAFLGDEHLGFVEVYSNNKKVYCWTLNVDQYGKHLPPEQEVVRDREFEGFSFHCLNPRTVNFF